MISNQILQSNIDGLKEITRIDLCVCDVEGKVLASTFEQAEEYENSILAFASRHKIFLSHIKSGLIRTTLLKTFCWITCSWWIFTTGPKSSISRQT